MRSREHFPGLRAYCCLLQISVYHASLQLQYRACPPSRCATRQMRRLFASARQSARKRLPTLTIRGYLKSNMWRYGAPATTYPVGTATITTKLVRFHVKPRFLDGVNFCATGGTHRYRSLHRWVDLGWFTHVGDPYKGRAHNGQPVWTGLVAASHPGRPSDQEREIQTV